MGVTGVRTDRAGGLCRAAVGAAIVALLLLAVLPGESPVSLVTQLVVETLCVGIVSAVALRSRAPVSLVWWGFAAYLLLTLVGDVVYDVQLYLLGTDPFPGWSDVLYLSAYVAEAGALLVIVRRRHLALDRAAWIDWAIIVVAAAAILGSLVFLPMLADSGEAGPLSAVVGVAYPALDLLLLAILVRLLLGGGNSNSALVLLTLSVLATLLADLIYNGLAVRDLAASESGWLTALFTAGFVLMAAAALSRGAASVTESEPTPPHVMTPFHAAALAIGTLTAPILLLLVVRGDGSDDVRFLALMSILVNLLVIWRAWILVGTVRRQSDEMATMARTDSVTGLPNRRSWDFELDRTLGAVHDQGTPLTLAMLDLDDFKRVNDRRGHQVGDEVLATCAASWRACLDPAHYLARYGGEEFAVLLPGVRLEAARDVLDRLRRSTPDGQTVSIGYAELGDGEAASGLLHRADQALYAAKSEGKDRVVSGG